MGVNWGAGTLIAQTGVGDAQTDRLLSRSRSLASANADSRIRKAGKDFESILLGNWLQQAEQSFATVPGGEGNDDDDGSRDQFQAIAMQALAGSLTASGGIGIAQMVTKNLRSQEGNSSTVESSAASPREMSATSTLNKSP